jgi:signal transduction histidine kinase
MHFKERFAGKISIVVPLLICFLLATFLPLVIEGGILNRYFRQELVSQSMIEAQNRCLILSNEMAGAGYFDNINDTAKNSALNAELDTTADFFGGRMVVVDSNYRIVRDSFKLSTGKTIVVSEVLRAFGGQPQSRQNDRKDFYYVAYPVTKKAADAAGSQDSAADDGAGQNVQGILLLTVSTGKMDQSVRNVSSRAWTLEFVILVGTFLLDIILASLLIHPIHRLQQQLHRTAEGSLDDGIDVRTYRETKDISDTVNSTVRQLRAIDDSQQEFVSNVSHELKTPITSIRVLADSLLQTENAPAEVYREFMTDISNEVDREAKIIDDLLTLVRMDRKNPVMNVTNVPINGLIEDVLKRVRPIARKQNIELTYESIREVRADVDEVKLSLAIMNLVSNAIKYNRDGGEVHVTLDADHRYFYVKVADNGIGIPAEAQKHIFEKFYRVDKARSRETGGTGLGLAITHDIIVLHHGAIRVQSREGEGSVFTVRIPLNYIP